jgi:hypothetical protein
MHKENSIKLNLTTRKHKSMLPTKVFSTAKDLITSPCTRTKCDNVKQHHTMHAQSSSRQHVTQKSKQGNNMQRFHTSQLFYMSVHTQQGDLNMHDLFSMDCPAWEAYRNGGISPMGSNNSAESSQSKAHAKVMGVMWHVKTHHLYQSASTPLYAAWHLQPHAMQTQTQHASSAHPAATSTQNPKPAPHD